MTVEQVSRHIFCLLKEIWKRGSLRAVIQSSAQSRSYFENKRQLTVPQKHKTAIYTNEYKTRMFPGSKDCQFYLLNKYWKAAVPA